MVASISGFEVSGHILVSYIQTEIDLLIRCMDIIHKPIEFEVELFIDLDGEGPPDGWDVNSPVSVGYRFDHDVRRIKTWRSNRITPDPHNELVYSSKDFEEVVYFLDNLGTSDVLVYMINDKTKRVYLTKDNASARDAVWDFKRRCGSIGLNEEDRIALFGAREKKRLGPVGLVESWMDQF